MIGELPTSLKIGGLSYPIRSDYRIALLIFQAYEDPELSQAEKHMTCIRCLYDDWTQIPKSSLPDALSTAFWFLDGGDIPKVENHVKTLDWEKDESIIFPAVNKVAGTEIRCLEYFHWWSFLGLFNEIGEGLFSTVLSIRDKKSKGQKLDKHEKEFYRNHRKMIDIRPKLSARELAEEQADEEFLNALTGGDVYG